MGLRSHLPELPTPSRCHEILATPLQLASTPPRHRARCTHLQTQPGRIQPIDSSHLAVANAVGRLTAPRSALEELL
ncbi:hypothetical protein L546_2069 [Bordetella pertussis H897]|nr:hypothetical protein L569_2052 [Bordetella pertussis 2250905]ETH36591.1 hypothetical protein L546_2069 [Bordetella pertussis H897]